MAFDPNKLVESAKKYLGKPYVWGGESEAEGGYDCSGFVYRALNDGGVAVSRDTAQGYYNRYKGNKTEKSNAGALLFFGSGSNNITHVAISLGGSKMIESKGGPKNTKSNPGKGVTESYISSRKDLVAACYPGKIASNTTPATRPSVCYPRYAGSSNQLDVIFKAIGAPYGNVAKRRPVAIANGFSNYTGSYVQNVTLIKLAKAGNLRRA